MNRRATISECGRYRYELWREWGGEDLFNASGKKVAGGNPYVNIIGLNPSTADGTVDDPTIRKCIGFAKRWGFSRLCMTNLFAYRATKPREMMKYSEPSGPENSRYVSGAALGAGLIVAAWGTHGEHMGQATKLYEGLRVLLKTSVPIFCLARNDDGSPQHPLYVPYETALKSWEPKK